MGILEEDVAKVRASTDVIAVISEHVELRRSGRQHMGRCPFHAEKTASFSVNAEAGVYYCFGCQAKGDIITFVREIDHLDFVGAVERLAARAGIQIRYDDIAVSRDRQRRGVLLDAMERAVEWYHQRLLTGPDGGAARGYLRSRGYDGDVVRQFRIGWAPDEWDALARSLHLPDEVLRDSGLGFVNRRQRQQDAFRARVLFPIFDASGAPVAFGGRIMPGAEGSKYKNSPETPLYSKSRTLYALNWAKTAVVEKGEVIVCEGYTDVIAFFGAGLPRAVATCGTALAEEHFRLLRSFASRVVLAYDADPAGQAAAERFYEWERKYEIDIAVAALPQGADPADVARRDPEGLRVAVEQARPFLAFRLERVLASATLGTAEGRARAAETAMALVQEHPSELVRDQYLMEVASRCRIDPAQLRSGTFRAPAKPSRAGRPAASRVALAEGPEEVALILLMQRPDEMAGLAEVLFADERNLAAYVALRDSGSVREALDKADPGAAELLHRLAVDATEAESGDTLALLAQAAAKRALTELHAEVQHADLAAHSEVIAWLKLSLEALVEPETSAEAVEQLVPWLIAWANRGQ